jgi:predicted dehydrogenase
MKEAKEASSTDTLRGLYLDAEADSGYIRDRNVFGDHIDIEDTMAVMARYDNGVLLNYSLVAYSPWEGFRVNITGTKGRIELFDQHGSHIIAGQSDAELAVEQDKGHEQTLRVFPMFGQPYDVEVVKAEGGHGGGDPILLDQLFNPNPPADPYHRAADYLDGAASMLIGISANQSITTGQPVRCGELLPL